MRGDTKKNQKIKYHRIEYIFLIILILYPLRKIFVGLDLMDAGYSLGNYRFFDNMDETWKLATYLANIAGVMLMKLPLGNTWVGMNAYTLMLISITAAASYNSLRKYFKKKWLLFLGEMMALSLCWAPSTILYHYLGYFGITAAVLILYRAIIENDKKRFIIAGVILGVCVFVRLPNITYMALIVPVWYGAFLYGKENTSEKNRFSYAAKQTGYCILGYLLGFGVPFGVICAKYGLGAYLDMISSLFGMTDTATDYKPTSMLYGLFADYWNYGVWLLIFAVYTIAGIILFGILKHKYEKTKTCIYILGMIVLLRFCYGRGMFGVDYQSYFSMYKWITVYLLMVILWCVFLITFDIHQVATERELRVSSSHKLWSAFLLIIIFITPLGSNNGIYPLINNLFLTAPVSLCLINENIFKYHVLSKRPVKLVIFMICICTWIQSFMFGMQFVFHDYIGTDQKREKADITQALSTEGLYSSVDKTEKLNQLGEYLSENDLIKKQVILYGNIPAIAYIFDMEPAIYTTWADLPSKTLELLQEDLDNLTTQRDEQGLPVIIFDASKGELIETQTSLFSEDEKLSAIAEFMFNNDYVLGFKNSGYYVYIAY